MALVVESGDLVSRHYLEQLRVSLKAAGDDRLERALIECDTVRFALTWATCLAAAVLLTLFVKSAILADGWDCLATASAGAILGIGNRIVDRELCRRYNRRFYEAIPENLRWCFRRTPS